MEEVLKAFTGDPKTIALAVLVGLDIVFGILAAFKMKQFSFSRVADFLRDDILYKLVPYYAMWSATYFGGDLVIPGIDVGALTAAAFAASTLTLGASLLASFKELGVPVPETP